MSELPSSKSAGMGRDEPQWDGRFFLLVEDTGPLPPLASFHAQRHVLYGTHSAGESAGFLRPSSRERRFLTPTKQRGDVSTACEFLGVFEYTMVDKWPNVVRYSSPLAEATKPGKPDRGSLLPRLNDRLDWCLKRAQEASKAEEKPSPSSVGEVVAVVGVVGQFACSESVNTLVASEMGKAAWPHLFEMMERRRFVFFHLLAGKRVSSPVVLGAPVIPARGGAGGVCE